MARSAFSASFISIASHSGAVFLDGLFSLTFAIVGLLTLYVSQLVSRPSDDSYPFGYATFEPMLNLFKGLLIGFALVYAVWTAVRTLLTGGQEIVAEGGILYAVIAVVGGAIVVVILKRNAKRSGSPIVDVDAKNWMVDTLISSAVGIAFRSHSADPELRSVRLGTVRRSGNHVGDCRDRRSPTVPDDP